MKQQLKNVRIQCLSGHSRPGHGNLRRLERKVVYIKGFSKDKYVYHKTNSNTEQEEKHAGV